MRTNIKINPVSLIGLITLFMFFSISCKKEQTDTIPTVTTIGVTDITSATAKVTIEVTDEGGAQVTGAGICWDKAINPDLSDNVSNVGQGKGEFISILTGLDPNTTYNVRAFATNKAGTAYGSNLTFTTLQ